MTMPTDKIILHQTAPRCGYQIVWVCAFNSRRPVPSVRLVDVVAHLLPQFSSGWLESALTRGFWKLNPSMDLGESDSPGRRLAGIQRQFSAQRFSVQFALLLRQFLFRAFGSADIHYFALPDATLTPLGLWYPCQIRANWCAFSSPKFHLRALS